MVPRPAAADTDAVATSSNSAMSTLSPLGIVHTALSLAPLLIGGWALATHGRIAPAEPLGRAYIATMLASIVTSFGLSSTGGIGPGHVLGVVAALLMGFAARPPARLLGRATPYLTTVAMSASYLILLIPGTIETLTRLPLGAPLAAQGPESPEVQATLAALFALFVVGSASQLRRVYRERH